MTSETEKGLLFCTIHGAQKVDGVCPVCSERKADLLAITADENAEHEFLALCPHYWGRNKDRKKAIQNMIDAGGSRRGMKVCTVPPGAKLDPIDGSSIEWPHSDSHPPHRCPGCDWPTRMVATIDEPGLISTTEVKAIHKAAKGGMTIAAMEIIRAARSDWAVLRGFKRIDIYMDSVRGDGRLLAHIDIGG